MFNTLKGKDVEQIMFSLNLVYEEEDETKS